MTLLKYLESPIAAWPLPVAQSQTMPLLGVTLERYSKSDSG